MKKRILSLWIILCILAAAMPVSAYNTGTVNEHQIIATGDQNSAVIKSDNSLWIWGPNNHGQTGDRPSSWIWEMKEDGKRKLLTDTTPIKFMDNVRDVSIGGYHVMAITLDDSLYGWGSNSDGQIGDGTTEDKKQPVKIMDNVETVSAGYGSTLAIKKDGSLWSWGWNNCGQLAVEPRINHLEPVKIMDNVKSISMGGTTAMAITQDSSLWSWGGDNWGERGDGTYGIQLKPVKIMDDVKYVSVGGVHTMIIKNDGSLWGCGYNKYGQLGTGDNKNARTPIKIMDNVKYVSSGYTHTMIIKNDGSLWACGENNLGQLGIGTTDNSNVPIKVMDNIREVSAGRDYTLAVTNLNEVFSWGSNVYSQLGDGSCDSKSSPIKILDNIKLPDSTNITPSSPTAAPILIEDEPQTADTISDETILKANILHNNDQFHYYKNVFRSPAVLLNEEQEKVYAKGLAKTYLFIDDVLNVLTLHLDNGDDLNASKYYEAVLADILETDSDGVWDNIYSTWKTTNSTYNNKIVQKVIGETKDLNGIKTSEFMKNNDKNVIFDTIIDYSKEQGICKDVTIDVDFFDKLSLSVNLAGDFFDAVNEVYAYTAVQQEKIDVLKDLHSKTDNPHLKSACATLINDIKFAHESALGYFATNWGKETAIDLFEFSHGIVAGLVLQYITTDTAGITPYIPGLTEAMAIVNGGRFISNILIKADDISKNILTVSAYASIESEIRKCAKQADNAFDKSKTIDNAVTLISYADFMKAAMLQSCDIFNTYVESVKKSAKNQKYMAVIGDVFNGDLRGFLSDISKSDNYDDALQICNRTKQLMKEADFYSNNGTDIVQYLRKVESTTPSSWAKEYVDRAIEYNILADYMENNYQNNITRAEFCTLITYTLETYSGKSIDELMEASEYKTELFEDTYYEFVYYMARLGIVNGVSETEFNPLGEISRQEAATMLMRAAKVVNVDISAPETDLSGVSDWAKEGVNFVVDRNIMTGTDNGFEPEGKYTKEQAITTMVRFYENLK